ncbi:HugZ family pyridoxamine 5'-phosphate oxidase [Acuticoccus mangrovi]|uniref:Pyridoxamine 5'-phosphate oxidase family protein n=1 Tax=Acuticoccus mangrovi TaxID=2796142 RepID=A0A934MEM7_9HYPH|nr:DUF2470 domain-containing protein [Acuticoccus mangrovi]MBJ3777702.1 pyridoxamine 5'-phosphate oxidase family protein [Acuticoccus mangrovi]
MTTEPAFDTETAARLVRGLTHEGNEAALGTLNERGAPEVSHVDVASAADGAPLLFVSTLARHTRNAAADPRASLLYVGPAAEAGAARARVTLSGRLEPVAEAEREPAMDRFLRRHPEATAYAGFADFRLLTLVPDDVYLVAGFGRITSLPVTAVVVPPAEALVAMDRGACEHMNEDHLDALKVMAEAIAGAPEGDWKAIAIDALGIDMAAGGRVVRVEYDAPVSDGKGLRMALKVLADRGRALQAEAVA